MADKPIVLNGKKLSEAQFSEEKKKLEKKKGVTVVQISENVYKTSIKG